MRTSSSNASDGSRASGRNRALIVGGVALGAIVLIAIAVFAYFALSNKIDAARKLDRATTLVEQADAVLVRIDEVISAEIGPELAAKAREAGDDADAARAKLTEAEELLDQAERSLGKQDRERATALRASASARLDMLSSAPTLLDLNERAAVAMPLANEGWGLLLQADDLSQQAVTAYNKLTKAGVTDSQRLNKQAGSKIVTARQRFISAEEAFKEAPFEAYVAYIDKRLAINRTSQATDKAWLAGDITKANALIKQYNTEDPKAVAQFKTLPASPDAAIGAAYDKASAELAKEYYDARDAALEADRKLR